MPPVKTTFRFNNVIDLFKSYWQSSERVRAFLLCAIIILLTVTLVIFDVIFSYWFNYFYDALQDYNLHAVLKLMAFFIVLASVRIVVQVYNYFTSQVLAWRWRKWLTKQFIQLWLQRHGYYHLEQFDNETDNPDQRIQEDVGALASMTIDLVTGLIAATTTFFAFIFILWQLSGVLTLPLGALGTWHIHGYLLWVGLIYAGLGTWGTFKIGQPLIGLNFEQQQREANFRFSAIDIREHAEAIALSRGESFANLRLRHLLSSALENTWSIILRQRKVLWFTASYNQAAVLLPLLAALPNYFNRVFKLGGLMQSLRAFGTVQESLSYLVASYSNIATWRAVQRRLISFAEHLDRLRVLQIESQQVVTMKSSKQVVVKKLNIFTPEDKLLLSNINLKFLPQQNYLLQGPSGIGKSTLIRTIAGIWPHAKGQIFLPSGQTIMYLPQRIYLPPGKLQSAIMFPDAASGDLESLLTSCRLAHLIPALQTEADWAHQLSPGEMQRIGFIRVLLTKPDWIFFDECTSALDIDNERNLYQLIKKELPNATYISVGHRPSLKAYHDDRIDVTAFSKIND